PEVWSYYRGCAGLFARAVKGDPGRHRDLLRWARHRAHAHLHLSAPVDYAFSGLFYQLLQFPMFADHLGEGALGGVRDGRPARNLALFSKLLTKFEYVHGIDVLTPEYLDLNLAQLLNGYLRFLRDGGIDEFEDSAAPAPS